MNKLLTFAVKHLKKKKKISKQRSSWDGRFAARKPVWHQSVESVII